MVRSRRLLEIIEGERLIEAAAETGTWFIQELQALQDCHPDVLSNARGRGLMCAIDLPNQALRNQVLRTMRENEHILLLPCGERSIRFRPPLCVLREDLQHGLDGLDRCLPARARRAAS
jgi:L-lysine 6-transaminase